MIATGLQVELGFGLRNDSNLITNQLDTALRNDSFGVGLGGTCCTAWVQLSSMNSSPHWIPLRAAVQVFSAKELANDGLFRTIIPKIIIFLTGKIFDNPWKKSDFNLQIHGKTYGNHRFFQPTKLQRYHTLLICPGSASDLGSCGRGSMISDVCSDALGMPWWLNKFPG